jgi:hypothetical protein
MIAATDFFTIPDFTHHEDPRAPGHSHNFASRNNIGQGAQHASRRVAFSLHH